ncbi:MAG TPA: transposase [Opitutaceae bacterium]|nr:transposase [Opitutaceae bacterium]
MRDPHKGHAARRRGRYSEPNREYYLTIGTDGKRCGLTSRPAAEAILEECRAMDADATWKLRCGVVMPDHLHLLIVLGERLSLGKCVARLKSKTAAALGPLNWERGFFDHYVLPEKDHLSLFLYIFLNPYREGLCAHSARWPWYYCRPEDWAWFNGLLDEERPDPRWLL